MSLALANSPEADHTCASVLLWSVPRACMGCAQPRNAVGCVYDHTFSRMRMLCASGLDLPKTRLNRRGTRCQCQSKVMIDGEVGGAA